MEKIVKAIVSDIAWNKLGFDQATFNAASEDAVDFETINTLITDFRINLECGIGCALSDTAEFLRESEESTASTPEIYSAAYGMAFNYTQRRMNPSTRPRPKKTSASKNARRPKPSPKVTSPQSTLRPTTPTVINLSTPPSSPNLSASTTQSQRPSKSSTKLQKSTPAPTVPHPSTSQSHRLPKASSNLHKSTPTPEMSQPTITSKFPAFKRRSTTKAAPSLPNSRFSHQIPFNFGWN